MIKEAVYHKGESECIYALSIDKLMIRLRTAKNDCNQITLTYVDKYNYLFWKKGEFKSVVMDKVTTDDLFDYFETIIEYNMISMGYFFKLENANEVLYYGNEKFYDMIEQSSNVCYLDSMFTHAIVEEYDLFNIPAWAESSIVYQIFPDRFYKGDNHKLDDEWYKEVDHTCYLGGTLQGVIDKIPYLLSLGINTVYFNPIFFADGNHKYVTKDYYTIDPQFGTNETFKELVSALHSNNIRIILDGVFSSTGANFFAFQDVVEKGAKSHYASWYEIYDYPIIENENCSYKSFGYFSSLPKLNFNNSSVREYIISVMEYWISEFDIDGWRLDCANEVPHLFWQEARKRVKNIKNDCLLVGEVWYDARSWLNGDQLDTVMNYMFFNPVLDCIALNKTGPQQLMNELSHILSIYKKQVHRLLWNLIGGHDTSRFLHEAKGDVSKLKLAIFLQCTFVGTPVIYYGDETGLSGANDPHCRKGMLWDDNKINHDLLNWYKKCISVRKNSKALIYGAFEEIVADDKIGYFGFTRKYNNESCVIRGNISSDTIKIELNGNYIDLITEKHFSNMIEISPQSGVILKKVE